MKKLLKNLLLFIIALLIYLIVAPLCISYAAFKSISHKNISLVDTLSNIFLRHAKGIDQIGNGGFYLIFNDFFIKDDNIHPFGDVEETISSVMGVNKINNNLTLVGKLLDGILSLIDDNHSIKSIKLKTK